MAWSPTNSGTYLPITTLFPGSITVISAATTTGGGGSAVGGSGVFIPFSDLSSYKIATSGDFREFVYSVVDAAFDRVTAVNAALASQDPAVAPLANLSMTRLLDATNLTNVSPSVSKSYTINSTLNVTGVTYDVAEE